MNILGLIPARGGSKGIAKKSITPCAGKPLLAYSCEAAHHSHLSHTIISTDCEEIAACAKQHGIDAPFLRPAEFADDHSPMIDVIRHTVEYFDEVGKQFDAVMLLQPTSPLRTTRHINEAIQQFESSGAESLVSITPVPHQFHPLSVLKRDSEYLQLHTPQDNQPLRRQDKPEVFGRNGPAIVITLCDLLREGKLYSHKLVGL